MSVTHAIRNDQEAVRQRDELPGWEDLSAQNERRKVQSRAEGLLASISTLKFGLIVAVLATGVTLYIGHVHATQDLLNRVQEARTQNGQLHLRLNQLKGEFDRRTGPAVIHERAREMGLEESIQYGPTIYSEP